MVHSPSPITSLLLPLVDSRTWTPTVLSIWAGAGRSPGVVTGSRVCRNHPHAQPSGLGIWPWLSKCDPGTSGSSDPATC